MPYGFNSDRSRYSLNGVITCDSANINVSSKVVRGNIDLRQRNGIAILKYALMLKSSIGPTDYLLTVPSDWAALQSWQSVGGLRTGTESSGYTNSPILMAFDDTRGLRSTQSVTYNSSTQQWIHGQIVYFPRVVAEG